MYAEIARRAYLHEAHQTWQDELLALARRIRSLLSAHPNWTTLLSRPVNGETKQSALVTRFARLKEWVESAAANEHRETRAALATVARFDFDNVFPFAFQSLIAGLEAKRSKA
jgi:hypothetical protein